MKHDLETVHTGQSIRNTVRASMDHDVRSHRLYTTVRAALYHAKYLPLEGRGRKINRRIVEVIRKAVAEEFNTEHPMIHYGDQYGMLTIYVWAVPGYEDYAKRIGIFFGYDGGSANIEAGKCFKAGLTSAAFSELNASIGHAAFERLAAGDAWCKSDAAEKMAEALNTAREALKTAERLACSAY